jgi:hypothetical protein
METMADMARTLTPSRFELLCTLQAQEPMTCVRSPGCFVSSTSEDLKPHREGPATRRP